MVLNIYRTNKVFVPGGYPEHTYVPRSERNLENRVRTAKDNLCKLITVTGATKSGKSVLVSRIFPRADSVWIDGGSISEELDVWRQIIEFFGGHEELLSQSGNERTSGIHGDAEGTAQIPLFASAKGSVGASTEKTRSQSEIKSRRLPPKSAALNLLRENETPLVIDDFHYLSRADQGLIIRALKPLVAEGLPVILIAIPHRRYDAVRVEREMTGRLESIPIPKWEPKELQHIPDNGFALLNINVPKAIIDEMIAESYASPHLMQEFCRRLAIVHGVSTTATEEVEISSITESLFREIADQTGRVVFEKLARGPRQRSDRIQRKLKRGGSADIYEVVLLALAKIGPGLDTVEYEQLRNAIRDVLSDNIPQAHEVTRVLEHMVEIAASDDASTPVIDWEKEEQKLHITDPFFAFYLRWGEHAN